VLWGRPLALAQLGLADSLNDVRTAGQRISVPFYSTLRCSEK
jgi:hypothetical protein